MKRTRAFNQLLNFILFSIILLITSCINEAENITNTTKSEFRFDEITIAELQKGYANGYFTIT